MGVKMGVEMGVRIFLTEESVTMDADHGASIRYHLTWMWGVALELTLFCDR